MLDVMAQKQANGPEVFDGKSDRNGQQDAAV
jgi:hypothetical protein